eukprot:721968-Pyramimonas_sp.AAC.1
MLLDGPRRGKVHTSERCQGNHSDRTLHLPDQGSSPDVSIGRAGGDTFWVRGLAKQVESWAELGRAAPKQQ